MYKTILMLFYRSILMRYAQVQSLVCKLTPRFGYRAVNTRLIISGFVMTIIFLSHGVVLGASSANISRSYKAASSIPNGSIVSLDPSQTGLVELANIDNGSRIVGVALPSNDSLLAVNPTNGTIQVAVSGTVNTLVSTVNGDIKAGDQVAVSPFGGIGMDATPGLHVIGIAQTSFNDNTTGATVEAVKDKSGNAQQVHVGFTKISIAIGTAGTAGNGGLGGISQLNFLQQIIKSLTGRTISTVRILLSIFIAIITLISLTTIIHAAVYSTIISIGRNPLARGAVYRALISVMLMTILTVSTACVAVFYLLN